MINVNFSFIFPVILRHVHSLCVTRMLVIIGMIKNVRSKGHTPLGIKLAFPLRKLIIFYSAALTERRRLLLNSRILFI